ncbi:MAG TPA: Calx-beta domain-containing protein [Nitrospirota bacterium]|nr:Calx-beta domain-containing protein [Nitrospirota bacterium]
MFSINFLSKAALLIIGALLLLTQGCASTKAVPKVEGPLSGIGKPLTVAVFPVENLSGRGAPLINIRRSLMTTLKSRGVFVIDIERLEQLMAKHRIRYVGGIDAATAALLRKEMGADAVLISTLELYATEVSQSPTPKTGLISRLVSTDDKLNILWMDTIGLTGDEHPGWFEAGVIGNPAELLDKEIGFLADSLVSFLGGDRDVRKPHHRAEKISFRSPLIALNMQECVVSFALRGTHGYGNGKDKIYVFLNTMSGNKVTVNYKITGGTARSGKDYILEPGTLTFNPGETVKPIDLTIVQGLIHGDSNTIEVTLVRPTNAVLGDIKSHLYTIMDTAAVPTAAFETSRQTISKDTGTIVNALPMPVVEFTAPSGNVNENAGTIAIEVKLSTASAKDVIIPFSVGGTARDQYNYKVITPSPLIIRAGAVTGYIHLITVDNAVKEQEKTVVFTLEPPSGAKLGSRNDHTLTIVDSDRSHRIAVLPFFNSSTRRYAGEIVMLHLVNQLVHMRTFDVVEPGIVRSQFLSMRLIMPEGVTNLDAQMISLSLDADLILSGKVLDYQDPLDPSATPKVDFFSSIIESDRSKVIWAARSRRQGDQGVFFFDKGRVYTASSLTSVLGTVLWEFLDP